MRARFSAASILCWIFVSCFPGHIMSTAVVTLDSCAIFKTHEWFKSKPTVYFQCQGENRIVLPDVKETYVIYAFKGQESWQPLTNFTGEKCKRCGFYEADTIPPDDVFDEWELCPTDFSEPNGRYTHIKEKEFNATFLCAECVSHPTNSTPVPRTTHKEEKGMHVGLIIAISVLVSTVFIIGLVAIYKYWLKKRRQQEQARFLKLFEDGDDIEDELALGNII